MVSPRPSRTTTGNLIHLTSKEMVAHPTSDVLLPTQDGGNSSDTKVPLSSMRKVRLLKFKVELTKRIETLESILKRMLSINNGISSM
jgi:hypothetical protein